MPTYEYVCKDCSHQFDIFQSFSEDTLTECPQCHGHLRKKFNSVGVVFKGSGFYRTDSRSSSTASDAPKTSSDAGSTSAPAAAASSGTSDAKASSASASASSSAGTSSGAAASA